jgi:hypothetical protein
MTNTLPRIDHLWAFLSVDEGGEGVIGAPLARSSLSIPMVAADEARLDSLIPLAKKISDQLNIKVRLVKFTVREEIEEYNPSQRTMEG